MNSLRRFDLISPAQYLADELESIGKREYLGGVVYAMSGGSNRHNRIATSVLLSLASRLRGHRCEPFNSDTKVRIQLPTHVRFYYPDAMVVCHPNPEKDAYQDHPAVVIEVLSQRTRRTDEGEKREAYCSIPSLKAYLMLEQDSPTVVAFLRGDQGFDRRVYEGLSAVVDLAELDLQLPLAEFYERVQFGPESEEAEEEN